MPEHILAIDQGTTSTRAIVFNAFAQPVSSSQVEIRQHFPRPGWVEHDPEEIFRSVVDTCRQAVRDSNVGWDEISAIGITNQRETTVLWERSTGRPVAPAIVWQCRRTSDRCAELVRDGRSVDIRSRTGLQIDPYFSATKLEWLLDGNPSARRRAANGELSFGTIDSWLLYRLTGGREHATDITNAGRTMLLNIHDQSSEQPWDETLLDLFGVDESLLPEVKPSAGEFGVTDAAVLGAEIPIMGIAGDQHAALFGQACFRPGMAKCTYGTGAFILQNTGSRAVHSDHGLLTTPAWQLGGRRSFALEGSIFTTGATVQWLRDGLGVIADASETGPLAESIPDNEGVYLVPAFTGLGAPYWDPDTRAAILGLTRGSGAAQMARAALESTAYQVRDVLEVMSRDASKRPEGALRVDGGQTVNGFLMQFQADILDRPINVAPIPETTALGAALLAGLTSGVWQDLSELESNWVPAASYEPRMASSERERLYSGWRDAVRRTQTIPSD